MKIQALKEVCRNYGWSNIYKGFDGLSQAMEKGTRHGPCPKTGEGQTKFRFFKDQDGGGYHNDDGPMPDGIEVLAWYTNQTKGEVIKMLEGIVGGIKTDYKPRTQTVAKPKVVEYCTPEEVIRREALIKKIYNESIPVNGTLAEVYLRSRGIKSFTEDYLCEIGNNLRFHAGLPYKEDNNSPWKKHPALIAIVRDRNGKPLTLHRTFLSHDGKGKAPISRAKMLLAPPRDMRGGYIMFDKPSALPEGGLFVGLAEGIENALSVREGAGAPMWVGISDRLLEMVNLPPEVRACAIYSDIEKSGAGQRSAINFIEANKSVDVINIPPKSKALKADWNDEYRAKGHKAFYMKMKEGMRLDGINFEPWWEHNYAEFN